MADRQITHLKAIDGPVASQPHRVTAQDKDGRVVNNNSWNNLLFGRNALDFINDKEAIEVGLGYEEVQNIMIHRSDAYDNGKSLYPSRLSEAVKKYFFLTNEELDYQNIECRFVP